MVEIKLWENTKTLVIPPVKTQRESSRQLHTLVHPIQTQRCLLTVSGN
jgi:hypothetical protein